MMVIDEATSAQLLASRGSAAGLRAVAAELDPTRILEVALSSQKALEALSRDAYFHANGFSKIYLWQNVRGTRRLRLHVWESEHEQTFGATSNVHNHTRAFSSRVVAGAIQVDAFGRCRAGRSFSWNRVTNLQGTHGQYQVEPKGTVRLVRTHRATFYGDDLHGAEVDALHAVRALAPLTATLVIQSEQVRRSTDVFSTTPLPARSGMLSRRLSTLDVARLLRRTIAATEPRSQHP